MAHSVTLLPGDTTGPAMCAEIKNLIAHLGVDIAWEEHVLTEGDLTDAALASVRSTKTALMAYHHGKRDQGVLPPVVQLRQAVNSFANVRPVHLLKGLPSRFEAVDLAVVRETTEDIYAHLEHESIPDTYESLKVTTKAACARIARFAFEYARETGRKKVTIVHKANIMKKSDGMFLNTARLVATEYPDIEVEDVIVDALCMKLIIHPERFDVLVAGNLFGDIVADVCAGIGGGPANCPSVNVSEDGVRLFSSPHGDRPGADPAKANPLALLLPTVIMLRHLGETEAANRLMGGIESVLERGVHPHGMGGSATCDDFCKALRAAL
ncbi:MAG: NAD-dependent isocitrate dehydrogenase [Deltaproteobacteria bacterium]|nr:MAG: NAD-dependent isocitrate dehydrogenase [Deltaproteobacteria bacterium]